MTVAVWGVVGIPVAFVGETDTPMKRVRAVPLTTVLAIVSGVVVLTGVNEATPVGTVLEFALSRTTVRSLVAPKFVVTLAVIEELELADWLVKTGVRL